MLQKLSAAYRVFFIEKRLPYGLQSWIQEKLYKKSLQKCLLKAMNTTPMATNPKSLLELHMVTCKRDKYMAILALKSFLRFIPDASIILHDDESLNIQDIGDFQAHFPGITVISYKEATQKISQDPELNSLRKAIKNRFQLDSSFEKQRKAWALKIFDFHFFSSAKKVMVLDSDTLFLKRPDEIISWIQDESPAFYAQPYSPNLQINDEMAAVHFPNHQLIKSFNGGLYGFNKDDLPIENIKKIAHIFLDNPELPLFGDECIWRIAFSQITCIELPYFSYPLFGKISRYKQYKHISEDFKYIHFLLKHDSGLYKKIATNVLKQLKNNNS